LIWVLIFGVVANLGKILDSLSDLAFYNGKFHQIENQKGEIKEIYSENDKVSSRQFEIQITNKGYTKNKFSKDIQGFLKNSGVNKGRTSFVEEYCYAESKLTNLKSEKTRIIGGNIVAIKVTSANTKQELNNITFYPFSTRNNKDISDKESWKTGVVAFDCKNSKSNNFLISFDSCDLRNGCGDENETTCIKEKTCLP
jgi:hypothetical protein